MGQLVHARIHSPVWPPPENDEAIAGAIFASGERRRRWLEEQASGHAIVRMNQLSPLLRGRLFDAIEDACDALIAEAGGARPGLGSFGSPIERIRDRLFRAHRIGRAGIVVALGSLSPLAQGHGALAAEDGEALRVLAAVDGPLKLVLEEADVAIPVFRAPLPLARVLDGADAEPEKESVSEPPSEPPLRGKPELETVTALAPAPSPPLPAVEHVFLPVAKPAESSEARVVAHPPTIAPRETPWRAHAAALAQARGPQPLAEFERLFAEHYVPLMTALELGLDDPRARAAAEEFRHTFARSYSEAFPTFFVTGKRPRLVLDAPDIAGRIARLHGARTVQLLLVDGMRYDLGLAVRDNLVVGLGPQAMLADETFLMSALPSITTRQLAGLARGVEGLRAQLVDANEGEALGGRTSEVVRRVRVGARDIYKLDVIEARLREADDAPPMFGEIARRAADAIVRHAATLPPRTLLFVFGDHGFSIDGAGELHQGGAAPEQVLMPAFAFLLGMVQ